MSENKNNKKKKDKNKDQGRREIRQVYLSEDGEEEKSVTTAVIDDKTDDADAKDSKGSRNAKGSKEEKTSEKKTSDHDNADEEHHHISAATKTLRSVAVAVAMFFSLMLSMTVGVGLALWDSNRTITDLGVALLGREVSAATTSYDTVPGDGDSTEASEADEIGGDTIPEDKDDQENDEVPGDDAKEPEEKEDYGSTLASDSDGLSKAGKNDEIVVPEDSDGPQALTDPLEDYPRPFTKVDESYFTDALFIGDSRLQGFGFWSGLPATYYCATGFHIYKYETTKVVQTENGKVPIFDAMPYDAFTKIYIKVGLNELGYGSEENFEQTYAQLIAKLREYEPRAIIYVHAILPVTAEKSATDKAHNNPNIVQRNAALKEFAKSQKAYFLDAGPVLSDDAGNLRPEMTTDGIHLKPEYMKIWREYLCENAVE